jgi:hypothetical protein
MCGVDFTVYDLIPAGAAWLRAVWVRHSSPPTVDASGGGAVAAESGPGLDLSVLDSTRLGDPIGDQTVHAELEGSAGPTRLDDPGVDREPLLVGG